MAKNLSDFEHGIFFAAGILVEDDQPGYAVDILAAAGLLESNVSMLDETEQRAMKKLMLSSSKAKFTDFTIQG
jgi:hypothetical protein